MEQILNWLAPILSALAVCTGQLFLSSQFKQADEKREMARLETTEKRQAEAEWRNEIEQRMTEFEKLLNKQDDKIDSVLKGQLTQMRSDIIHKAHRYIDDLGCASTEEKNAFNAEFHDYEELCMAYEIKNDFVSNLHNQVMSLPGRNVDLDRSE